MGRGFGGASERILVARRAAVPWPRGFPRAPELWWRRIRGLTRDGHLVSPPETPSDSDHKKKKKKKEEDPERKRKKKEKKKKKVR